ncbi:MAG: tetratricopeptide repeat protein [Deltaproteobacteria bacterium]|nr:tetratricopeptide repeat protein [Deltaproteobacteria bacterium]
MRIGTSPARLVAVRGRFVTIAATLSVALAIGTPIALQLRASHRARTLSARAIDLLEVGPGSLGPEMLPDTGAALRLAVRARAIDPELGAARYALHLGTGIRDLARHDLFLAEGELGAASSDRPGAAAPRRYLGMALLEAGRLGEARVAFDAALSRDSHDVHALVGLGDVELERGDHEAALPRYEAALELEPRLASVHDRVGLALARSGRLEEAERALRRGVALDGRLPEPRVSLGNLLLRQGRIDEAEAAYRGALSVSGTNATAHLDLGILLFESGRSAEAERHLARAAELDLDDPTARGALGDLYAASGSLPSAIASYNEAIERDPASPALQNNLGNALERAGRLDDAERAFRRAIELDPVLAFPHNGLGSVLLARGDGPGAIAELERAVSLAPDVPHAYFNLGLALTRVGRGDAARTAFDRACELGTAAACGVTSTSRGTTRGRR